MHEEKPILKLTDEDYNEAGLQDLLAEHGPAYNINIDGFSLGGPIVIPKIYNGKKKMFFFGSQEYTNDQRPVAAVTAYEPTAAMLTGDFSGAVTTAGKQLPIIDPLNGSPFAGNIIPGSRIDPVGLAFLKQLTPPNGYTNATPGQQFTATSFAWTSILPITPT